MSLAVPLRGVGLLGELRVPPGERSLVPEPLLRTGLVAPTGNGWVSRGARYYRELDLHTALREGAALLAELRTARCSADSCAAPSAYILADHALNRYVRVAFTLAGLWEPGEWWHGVLAAIDACATVLARILHGEHRLPEIPVPPEDPADLPNRPVRTLVDGDNHAMTVLALRVPPARMGPVFGLLLGAGAAAPIAAALWQVPWTYVLLSLYDVPDRREPLLIEGPRPVPAGRALLLDDNCGTGRTLASAGHFLATRTHRRTSRLTVELHWEKLLRVRGFRHSDPVFDVEELSGYPPWCYRHHHLIRRLAAEAARGSTTALSTADWALYSLSTLRVLRDCLPADSAERAAVETALSAAQRIASDPSPGGQPGVLRALLAACTVNRVPAARPVPLTADSPDPLIPLTH